MGTVHVCDLCGEPLPLDYNYRYFGIFERTSDLFGFHWRKIEVHNSCLYCLMHNLETKEEQRDES